MPGAFSYPRFRPRLEGPDIVHEPREPAGLLLVGEYALAVVLDACVRDLGGKDAVVRIHVTRADHAAHHHELGLFVDADLARALDLEQAAGEHAQYARRHGRRHIILALGLARAGEIACGAGVEYRHSHRGLRPDAHQGDKAGLGLAEHGGDLIIIVAVLVRAGLGLVLGLGVFHQLDHHDVAHAARAAVRKERLLLAGREQRPRIVAAVDLLPVFLRRRHRLLERGALVGASATAGRAEQKDRPQRQCQCLSFHWIPLLTARSGAWRRQPQFPRHARLNGSPPCCRP